MSIKPFTAEQNFFVAKGADLVADLQGRALAEDRKAKIKVARKKQVMKPEAIAKLHSPEAIQKREAAKQLTYAKRPPKMKQKPKGRPPMPAHVKAVLAASMARPEVRAKISAATKGRPKSEETKARMKAAWEIRRAALKK